MARLLLCVITESDGGFSPGYVLLSFQLLTPSSRQCPTDYPVWTLVTPSPCIDWGKSSLWRRLAGDRPSQEGRDKPEFPKPRSSSRVTPSLGLPLWIGLDYCPECKPSTTVDLATRSGCRQGVVMGEVTLSNWSLDKPQWRAQDKDIERTQQELTSRTDLMKPEGSNQTRFLHPMMPWLRLSSDGSGGFKPWWFYRTRDWVDQA